MANLRQQARRNARLQFRPQLRELNELKREARQMMRSGTRAERQAARGIMQAAEQAIGGVRRDYRRAGEESRLANRLGGAIGDNTFAQADALSRRQNQRGIAEAIAAEIGDLRARMVRAQEGAAYGARQQRAQYASTLGDIQDKRGAIKADMGAFAKSELDRLRSERAAAQMERAKFEQSERRLQLDERKFRFDRRDRLADNRRLSRGDKGGGRSPEKVRSQSIKQEIIDARAKIERDLNAGVPMKKIAKSARKNGVSETVFSAAAMLARRGWLDPDQVQNLRRIGVRVPRPWRGAVPGL